MAAPPNLDALTGSMPSQGSQAGPSRSGRKEVTYEDFQAMLDSTPLFMRETPKDGGDDDLLEALRSLVFEGEGDEVALNFKNHGNELYIQKSYREAIKAYSDGIDAGPVDTNLRISLLNNRAACQLALKNHGSVLKDVGLILALAVQNKGTVVPVKAMYRAGQALVALERWKEAGDVVRRGKEMEGQSGEKVWIDLESRIERGVRTDAERRERTRRERLTKEALKRAVEERGLITLNTPSPPDNPHPLHFDPDSLGPKIPLYQPNPTAETNWHPPDPSVTPLVFPVFLLYPTYQQSDLITHFQENTSLNDQLAAMFPSGAQGGNVPWAPWDTSRRYWTGNLVVYVETKARRLLKAGKELSLREVIAKAVKADSEGKNDGMVLRDGLLSFVVLAKGEEEEKWIDDFKRNRNGAK